MRKSRWVLGVQKTIYPIGYIYAGVVSREIARMVFDYSALNVLEIFDSDIKNAYFQAPYQQKYYIIIVPEFGL